jgi:hypothetical protein
LFIEQLLFIENVCLVDRFVYWVGRFVYWATFCILGKVVEASSIGRVCVLDIGEFSLLDQHNNNNNIRLLGEFVYWTSLYIVQVLYIVRVCTLQICLLGGQVLFIGQTTGFVYWACLFIGEFSLLDNFVYWTSCVNCASFMTYYNILVKSVQSLAGRRWILTLGTFVTLRPCLKKR